MHSLITPSLWKSTNCHGNRSTYVRYAQELEDFISKYKSRPQDIKFWPYGPYWPSDSEGPIIQTPRHIRRVPHRIEKFNIQDTSSENPKKTFETQQTPYLGKWRGTVIIYDSERSGKDYEPPPPSEKNCPNLTFESRFESGNLRQARRVGQYEYELVLKTDLYTCRHTQWYYFRIQNAIPGIIYKFKIINLLKKDSLYNHGMKPLLYSEKNAAHKSIGWVRSGHHIAYSRNSTNLHCPLLQRDMAYYILEWQMEFPNADDTYYVAHCYPYTFTDLKNDLDHLLADPKRSPVMRREVMCETRAGNSCFLVTVTNFENEENRKKGIVVSARVHPGESNSSWMMKGLLTFITGPSLTAKELRNKFVFKIVPMLNPDGVIVGNYRCSLAARDLNRNYRHPRKESFPTIWHIKSMMEDFGRWNDILIYCDLHGHSRKQNVFMYGCNTNGQSGNLHSESFIQERVFPWLMSQKAPDKFSFQGCKFQIRKCKESTGRVVMFRQLKVCNSFTMEATFCGTTISKGQNRHFNTSDLQEMGQSFCEAVLEYQRMEEDKEMKSDVILDLTKYVMYQVLESRGLIPSDLPDITTEAGRDQLKEYLDSSVNTKGSLNEQLTGAIYRYLEHHSPPPGDIQEKGIKSKNALKGSDSKSKMDIHKLLDKLSNKTIDGCIELLDQLKAQDTVLESDSSDSDSESEPELKWVEPRPKKKKKKSKKSKSSQSDTKDKADKTLRPNSTSALPAIQNAETESQKKSKKGTSMNKYVKNFVETHPKFVNKYKNKSNGGIPCFSEERLLNRATKRMTEIKKRMEEEQQRRDAALYSVFENEESLHSQLMQQKARTNAELRQQFQQFGLPVHIRTGYMHGEHPSSPYEQAMQDNDANLSYDSLSSDDLDTDISQFKMPIPALTSPYQNVGPYQGHLQPLNRIHRATTNATKPVNPQSNKTTTSIMITPVTKQPFAEMQHGMQHGMALHNKAKPGPRRYSLGLISENPSQDKRSEQILHATKQHPIQQDCVEQEYTDLLLEKLKSHHKNNMSAPQLSNVNSRKPDERHSTCE